MLKLHHKKQSKSKLFRAKEKKTTPTNGELRRIKKNVEKIKKKSTYIYECGEGKMKMTNGKRWYARCGSIFIRTYIYIYSDDVDVEILTLEHAEREKKMRLLFCNTHSTKHIPFLHCKCFIFSFCAVADVFFLFVLVVLLFSFHLRTVHSSMCAHVVGVWGFFRCYIFRFTFLTQNRVCTARDTYS